MLLNDFLPIVTLTLLVAPTVLAGGYGHEDSGHGYEDSSGDGGYGKHYNAAVKSKHSIHSYPAHSSGGYHKTPVVDINSHPMSIKLRFNSHSSNIKASQKHFGSGGKVKKSYSVDHPDILIHRVKKPVIQEVKEIITPYRKRIQIVKPVREKVETIIATGHNYGGSHKMKYGGGGGGHYHGYH